MRFLLGLFRRRDPTAPKVDWVSGARKPGVCCQCGRSLTAVPGGVFRGQRQGGARRHDLSVQVLRDGLLH